ncbi:MAG: TetR/AcrR family transcriptional regulator [Eubacteriales bacterium]|nr:TetR/AcrR family transcriptional regulator [Eubacteriales bacterium]
MRKKDAEIKKTLLSCANRIECSEGVGAISIRRLAAEANIAIGTVYHYFDSKQDVLLTLTEEYWKEALLQMRERITAEHFDEQLREIINFLRSKMNDCAEILMQSLQDDAETGRLRMASMQRVLRQSLIERMESDDAIADSVWSESFTKEAFADFVFLNVLSLLQRKDADTVAFLEIVNRILYPNRENALSVEKRI